MRPKAGPFSHSFWPPEKFSENLHLSYAWSFLRKHPASLIHSHLENAAGFWAVCRDYPTPGNNFAYAHYRYKKRDYLLHFPQVHLVAVSEFQRQRLEGHPKLEVIPHGLDVAAYRRPVPKEDFLLFLGRIYPEKGWHMPSPQPWRRD